MGHSACFARLVISMARLVSFGVDGARVRCCHTCLPLAAGKRAPGGAQQGRQNGKRGPAVSRVCMFESHLRDKVPRSSVAGLVHIRENTWAAWVVTRGALAACVKMKRQKEEAGVRPVWNIGWGAGIRIGREQELGCF